ncbi:hypothetical protein N9599_06645 [Candidatus Pelagibacter sp.]|nr:hypothetical protein [Candidatus Pelagibacter sp.]
MINDKQDDRQEDRTVKFTDYAIDKYQFNFDNYKGKSVGVKLENSGLKGLKLTQYKTSKKKYFHQKFWFDGKTDLWSVGKFIKGKFGIKECKTKVVAIMNDHTDDNGLWIKSPKITARQHKQRISKAELENRQLITITTAIERFCKAGFPKIKQKEQDSIYMPRIDTNTHSYINWLRSKYEIFNFIKAFDEPFNGARTFLNKKKCTLTNAKLIKSSIKFHPYQSGIILRQNKDICFVAVNNGILIANIHFLSSQKPKSIIGKRLFTPMKFLELALTSTASHKPN